MNRVGLSKEDIDGGRLSDSGFDYLLTVGEWAFKCLSSPKVAQWGVDPPRHSTRRDLKHIVGINPDKTRDHFLNAAEQLFEESGYNTERKGLIVLEGLSMDALPRLGERFIDSLLAEEWSANEPWYKWALKEGDPIQIVKWTKHLLRNITWAKKAQFEATRAMGVKAAGGKRFVTSRIWQAEGKTYIEFLQKHGIRGQSGILKLENVHPYLDGLHLVDQKISATVLAVFGLPRIAEFESGKQESQSSLRDAVISLEYEVDPSRVVYHILRVDSTANKWKGKSASVDFDEWDRPVQDSRRGTLNTRSGLRNQTNIGTSQPSGHKSRGEFFSERTSVCKRHNVHSQMQKPRSNNCRTGPFHSAILEQDHENSQTALNSWNQNEADLGIDLEDELPDVEGKPVEDNLARTYGPSKEACALSQGLSRSLVTDVGMNLTNRFGSERMMEMLIGIVGPMEVCRWLDIHEAGVANEEFSGLTIGGSTKPSTVGGPKLKASFVSDRKYSSMVEGAFQIEGNSILCVPERQRARVLLEITGRYLRQHAGGKIVVLAQSGRNGNLFLSNFRQEGFERAGFRSDFFSSGQGTKLNCANWRSSHQSLSIMIMAPQLLHNSILGDYGKLTDFGLIIMDECHQVCGGSASKLLLKNYLSLPLCQQSNPKIVGLTSDISTMTKDAKLDMCRCMSVEMTNLCN